MINITFVLLLGLPPILIYLVVVLVRARKNRQRERAQLGLRPLEIEDMEAHPRKNWRKERAQLGPTQTRVDPTERRRVATVAATCPECGAALVPGRAGRAVPALSAQGRHQQRSRRR